MKKILLSLSAIIFTFNAYAGDNLTFLNKNGSPDFDNISKFLDNREFLTYTEDGVFYFDTPENIGVPLPSVVYNGAINEAGNLYMPFFGAACIVDGSCPSKINIIYDNATLVIKNLTNGVIGNAITVATPIPESNKNYCVFKILLNQNEIPPVLYKIASSKNIKLTFQEIDNKTKTTIVSDDELGMFQKFMKTISEILKGIK